jgi:hypothetical protein
VNLNKLKHSRWTLLAPLGLTILSTLAPETVRVICLAIAWGVSVWIFYDTELAKGLIDAVPKVGKSKRIMRTTLASIVFLALAVTVFVGTNSIEKAIVAHSAVKVALTQDKTEAANAPQGVATSQQSAPVPQPPSNIDSQTAKKQKSKKDHSKIASDTKTASEITKPASQSQPAQQDNSVRVEHGSKIEQQSSGDCSPNIIGGSNTVKCAPEPRIANSSVGSLAAQLALCSSGSTTAVPNVVNPTGFTEQDAQNLATAFAKTRMWSYSGVGHTVKGQDIGPDGPVPDPVGIHIYSDASHQPLAKCVQDALQSIGVRSVVELKADQGNSLGILVGNTPN